MMIQPTPGVLDQLIRERQEQLRMRAPRAHTHRSGAVRVRIGHALIAAGRALIGERAEAPARPPGLPKTA